MVFEVLGHRLAGIEAFLDFCMRDVAAHDDGAFEREARAYGIFVKLGKDFRHRTVEVDFHHFAFALVAERFGDELSGEFVELLHPKAFAVDFRFHVAVGRAAYAHSYGAGSAVARQTDHADVVCEVFASELCSETDALRSLKKFLLQLHVAECAAVFVAGGGEVVVILH